jgi:type II secretory pathway pseudopilin PulG
MKTFKNQSGFTVIELLFIIIILSILVGFTIPRLINIREKAIQIEDLSFLTSMKNALEIYYTENDKKYPEDGVDLTHENYLGKYIDDLSEVIDNWEISYNYLDENDFTVTMKYKSGNVTEVILIKTADGYTVEVK